MRKTSYPLRIQEEERIRAKQLANDLGISENRLYAELIHDGMLVREQMQYMSRLHQITQSTHKADALAILNRVKDTAPSETDVP